MTERRDVRRFRRRVLAVVAAAVLAGAACAPRDAGDFTFLLISDIHLGADKPEEEPPVRPEDSIRKVRAAVDDLLALSFKPFPDRGPFQGRNPGPPPVKLKGLLIAGDLTDGSSDPAAREAQWKMFADLFPAAGVPLGGGRVQVYPCLGNHDGGPEDPVRRGLIVQNRERLKAGTISALSENGLHYAVRWDGLHLICVNLYPADGPDLETPFKFGDGGQPGKWNDPEGALSFCADYLSREAGGPGQSVIIMMHYGFTGFSINDWNWWTPKQRRRFYELIKDYQVAALLHGHDHEAQHYFWPDPEADPGEIQNLFGSRPPAGLRRFDVFAAGHLGWIFRIQDGALSAMHHNGEDWTEIPELMVVKPLVTARR